MASIIFDLDGTLVDSAPDIHAALNRTMVELSEPLFGRAIVISFVGNGVPVLIDRAMHARGHAPDANRHALWERRFLHHYNAASAVLTQPYPGVVAALEALTDAGHLLGLCTNKPELPARHVLAAFDLTRFFPVVIGGDTLAQRKPDAAPLRAVARALEAVPAIFVGDSEVDADTALAAAVPFLLFTEGYRKSPAAALPAAARFADWAVLPGLVATLT